MYSSLRLLSVLLLPLLAPSPPPVVVVLVTIIGVSYCDGKIDPVALTRKLIEYPTISPDDKGSLTYLTEVLQSLGFRCSITETGHENFRVRNLYARVGNETPHLCFVGHIDVVPPGDLTKWTYPPYAAEIHDGALYGRGAVDMKSAIGAFTSAVSSLQTERLDGSVSLIITGNEEGPHNEYGTESVLKLLRDRDEKLDFAIIGEPTSEHEFGDMTKIGRRGSITFQLRLYGKQGHVAYHELADNPVDRMVDILSEIKNTILDNGTEHFQPSNCEIVSIDVGNSANNVIPGAITSRINIRYNTLHSSESLTRLIRSICERRTETYNLTISSVGGGAFLSGENKYTALLADVIKNRTGIDTKLSTTGGTSDARFVKNYCDVVEFGLLSKTAHHYDENTLVTDIYKLTDIYKSFIEQFFEIQ